MLGFNNFGEVAVFLHTGVHDMRIGFDRLTAPIEEQCQRSVVCPSSFRFGPAPPHKTIRNCDNIPSCGTVSPNLA